MPQSVMYYKTGFPLLCTENILRRLAERVSGEMLPLVRSDLAGGEPLISMPGRDCQDF